MIMMQMIMFNLRTGVACAQIQYLKRGIGFCSTRIKSVCKMGEWNFIGIFIPLIPTRVIFMQQVVETSFFVE